MRKVKDWILMSTTAATIAYMLLYVFFFPLMGTGGKVFGAFLWILAAAWTGLFILVNFIWEDIK